MSTAEVPEIRSIPAAVLQGVGQEVQVFIHEEDPQIGPVRRSSHDIVSNTIEDVFRREGIPYNRDLELLCVVVARTAIGKLVTSQGFDIEFGVFYEPPTHATRVELRPSTPTVHQADVTNT